MPAGPSWDCSLSPPLTPTKEVLSEAAHAEEHLPGTPHPPACSIGASRPPSMGSLPALTSDDETAAHRAERQSKPHPQGTAEARAQPRPWAPGPKSTRSPRGAAPAARKAPFGPEDAGASAAQRAPGERLAFQKCPCMFRGAPSTSTQTSRDPSVRPAFQVGHGGSRRPQTCFPAPTRRGTKGHVSGDTC